MAGRLPSPRRVRARAALCAALVLSALALALALAPVSAPVSGPTSGPTSGQLSAPAAPRAGADGGGRRVLTVAVAQSVDSLSPFLAQRLVSTTVHRLAYEYLTNYDPRDGRVIPGLATAWKSSPSKLIWTYTIRTDSFWSDGRPVTAEDAAWTFRTMMSDEKAATANGSFTANFRKVTAPDPVTLVVELRKPQATMVSLDVPIVPRHIWEKVRDFGTFNNDRQFPVVGNGPFVITECKVDRFIVLKSNKRFWRGAPAFDELVLRFHKDGDAAVAALRKGEVSFVHGLVPAQAAALKRAENIKVNDAPGRRFLALAVNPGAWSKDGTRFGTGHRALRDPVVRRALFHAVNRSEIVEGFFRGHAVEGEGYIPPRFGAYFWKPGPGQRIAHDPERAALLLDRAGYRKNRDGARVGKDGRPLSFRLLCHATEPIEANIGKYLHDVWRDLGIETRMECRDNISDPWLRGDYDLAFDGWSVNPDPDFVLAIHTCAALPETPRSTGSTDNFICDREFDDLYAEQIAEYDPIRRADVVRRMQSRLYDTGLMHVLAYPNAVEAYRTDHIASITTMPEDGGNLWGQDGYWSWWSAEPAEGGGAGSGGSGSATEVVVGIGALVAVAAVIGALVALRRRATADYRE
ncbi:peptide ABC transporter substrate-binding protein [Streptomyces sp. NPDC001985]|uniref:ABC transporter substrate-binding protein n=1 Tax=Streptomyces sp. NPDC001985 TaxID=3154406 RepID=UPI0033230FD6